MLIFLLEHFAVSVKEKMALSCTCYMADAFTHMIFLNLYIHDMLPMLQMKSEFGDLPAIIQQKVD